MPKRRNDPKPKPVEEWTAKEWEFAYHKLVAKFEELQEHMRVALNHLGKAQYQLSNAI